MCSRCEELEEEVAYLRSELGEEIEADAADRVRRALRLSPDQAAIVLTLYRAGGRPVSMVRIDEALPVRAADRGLEVLRTKVSQIRRELGKGFILSARPGGYRLPPPALDIVARLVGDTRPELTLSDMRDLQEMAPERLRHVAALVAGVLAHKDGDGGKQAAQAYRRIADRLTGAPRIAA